MINLSLIKLISDVIDPTNISVTVGDPVSFKVRDTEANEGVYCSWTPPPVNNAPQAQIRFLPPGDGKQSIPDKGNSREYRPVDKWTWEWYGDDAKIDCGLTLEKTVRWDNGNWQYSFAAASGIEFFLYVKGSM